jgi:Holliday junction resolvase RusA-like endonuclease
MNQDIRTFNIELAMEPPISTHQSALRIIKPKGRPAFIGKYDKSEVVQWRKDFVNRLKDYRSLWKVEKGKPVYLSIILSYVPPKSRPLKNGAIRPKVTKPDLDNVAKAIIDGMVDAGCFETDEQVFSVRLTKVEWERPFIILNYTEVNESNWTLAE